MNASPSPALPARVASLHLHPPDPGAPLRPIDRIEAVAGRGVQDDLRYFDRIRGSTGAPSRRHIRLIEREQIDRHAAALGLPSIPPGVVRANVETLGIDLIDLIGRDIRIGGAVLRVYEARQPCEKMDAICAGLRQRMEQNRQGVLAEIVRSGTIRVGDAITCLAEGR
jgi:hypothetical protein